jgi:hypothetical protein
MRRHPGPGLPGVSNPVVSLSNHGWHARLALRQAQDGVGLVAKGSDPVVSLSNHGWHARPSFDRLRTGLCLWPKAPTPW